MLVKSDVSKPYAYDILTTRSADAGETWSTLEILHADGTQTEHGFVSLLPDGDDRALAVWLDARRSAAPAGAGEHDHGGAHTSLRTAVLTRSGIVERRELDDLTCDCCRTSLARGPTGPVVLYRDRTVHEIRDILSVTRGASGWGEPTQTLPDNWQIAGCPVNGPAVIPRPDGLLASWPTQADGTPTLRLARWSAGGWEALPTLDRGPDVLARVDLASWGDDTALATWIGGGEEPHAGHRLFVALLDDTGTVLERHVVSELPAGRGTGMPRIASRDGRALLVWTLPGETGPRLRGVLLTPG